MDPDFFRLSIESALAPHVPDGAVSGLVSEPPPPKVARGGGSGKARRSSGQRVKLADLSVPCFRMTRAFEGMKPPAIAAHLLAELGGPPVGFSEVVANGPYLNFFFDPAVLAEKVLEGEIEPAADPGRTIHVE